MGAAAKITFLLFSILSSSIQGASFNESCDVATAAPCESLLIISTADNTSLVSIAAAFSVDPLSILAANGFPPHKANLIFEVSQQVAVPVKCDCNSGIRAATATYIVVPDDTLSAIASDKYGRLVTYQEIANASSIPNPDEIIVGQKLTVPLPCACHENFFGKAKALYASYAVQLNDTLAKIGAEYGSTAKDLENLNSINATNLADGQVIQIPVKACSSGSELIPGGSYATFGNGCVQCSCRKNGTTLQCSKSPVASPTCSVKCENSSLEIGQFEKTSSNGKCIVRSCSFDGTGEDGRVITSIKVDNLTTPCNDVKSPPTFAYAPIEATAGGPLPAFGPTLAPPPMTSIPVFPPNNDVDAASPPSPGGDVNPASPPSPGGASFNTQNTLVLVISMFVLVTL